MVNVRYFFCNQEYWWIGLTDKRIEGEYEWETSKDLLTSGGYKNWGPGEPDGVARENCVFYAPSRNNQWADGECSRTENYICEKEYIDIFFFFQYIRIRAKKPDPNKKTNIFKIEIPIVSKFVFMIL